jgi:hypothetical protein
MYTLWHHFTERFHLSFCYMYPLSFFLLHVHIMTPFHRKISSFFLLHVHIMTPIHRKIASFFLLHVHIMTPIHRKIASFFLLHVHIMTPFHRKISSFFLLHVHIMTPIHRKISSFFLLHVHIRTPFHGKIASFQRCLFLWHTLFMKGCILLILNIQSLLQMPVPQGNINYRQGPSCWDRIKLGFFMGASIGLATGVLFGGFQALRYLLVRF